MSTTAANRVHSIFKVKAEGRTRIIVFDTQDLSLGRAPENDLAIDDAEMSRRHAVFSRSREGCMVQDQGTSNGTVVNGEAVTQAQLASGDVIQIGEVEITYVETSRNPASIKAQVEYASQLKDFQTPMSVGDGEATILGLMDAVAPDDADEFEVRPAGDFDSYEVGAPDKGGAKPRNLDLELDSLGSDPVDDLDFESAPPVAPASRESRPPDTVVGTQVWDLEDAPARGKLALTLEIEGLSGESRRIVEGLIGKVIELPSLRVRIKADDLS